MLITMILISTAVFLALIKYSAQKPERRGSLVGAMFMLAAVGGLILYSQIYSVNVTNPATLFNSILQTLISVGRMFAGVNDYKGIPAQYAENKVWMIIYWMIHFFAYYSMASAVIILLGKNVIKWSRFLIMRFRKLEIIYGVSDGTVTFGSALAKDSATDMRASHSAACRLSAAVLGRSFPSTDVYSQKYSQLNPTAAMTATMMRTGRSQRGPSCTSYCKVIGLKTYFGMEIQSYCFLAK